jgi:WD40 repeat protein
MSETNLIIGTFGCEILEVSIQKDKKSIGSPKALIQGHHAPKLKDTNEVWGLCTIPGTNKFITVSDDATLRVWDATTK